MIFYFLLLTRYAITLWYFDKNERARFRSKWIYYSWKYYTYFICSGWISSLSKVYYIFLFSGNLRWYVQRYKLYDSGLSVFWRIKHDSFNFSKIILFLTVEKQEEEERKKAIFSGQVQYLSHALTNGHFKFLRC